MGRATRDERASGATAAVPSAWRIGVLAWGTAVVLLASSGAVLAQTIERFTGRDSDSTRPFQTEAPWLLTWHASSAVPTLAELQILLYHAPSNDFVGVVLNQTGTGSGQKVIVEPGRYRLVVVGRAVNWSIRIEHAPEEITALLRRRPDITRVDIVPPRTGLSRELVARLRSWHAEGDTGLVLRTEDGETVRVGFAGNEPCPGLQDTENIYFVTAGLRAELFNAIVTEEGTRCYLGGSIRVP